MDPGVVKSRKTKCLIDLLWDDILFVKILPYLSIKELFILRGLSKKYRHLINTYFKQMKCLHLAPYSKIFSVVAFKVLSKHCNQLQEVVMTNCLWLTDELIVPLFEKNTNLTKLVLNKCSALTSVCLQPVIINCKSLQSLHLAQCAWLTVGCLQSITLHQHNLVEVDFSACLMANVLETINNFIFISHRIRVLNMSKLTCVNDSTLIVLARSAKQLESLNIGDCHQVTGYGISMVIEYCKNLRGLMCVGCPLVSRQSLSPKRRVNLHIIPAPPGLDGGLSILLPRGLNV